MQIPFTDEQVRTAYQTWGCNCGPLALAFAMQMPLSFVKPLIPNFQSKRHTNPTMMRAALNAAGQEFKVIQLPVQKPGWGLDIAPMYGERSNPPLDYCPCPYKTESPPHLVRVQWTGPWMEAGAKPKWRYRHTHWICTWLERGRPLVFDCNGGIMHHDTWETEIVPMICETIPQADGGWLPTHIWRLK